MNLLNVPIDFAANLFNLKKMDEELKKYYHGYYIFNNRIYNEKCERIKDLKL